jgi:hypothetical protein
MWLPSSACWSHSPKDWPSVTMIEDLLVAMRIAIAELERWPGREVQLFHHNDSDGLSSGAVLTRAFERKGFAVRRFCLEKPYPDVLDQALQQQDKLLVFTDFAGRIAPMICDLNRGRNLVLILDHHKATPSTDQSVHNLDPELFGLHGDREITASTTCYLFALTLDPRNSDLAPIATIGAVGDGFFVGGRLAGPNREVALESQRQGRLRIETETDGSECYTLLAQDGEMLCADLGDYLDTLGAAGYYRQGPEVGIDVCLEGRTDESDRMVEELKCVQETAFAGEVERIRQGELSTTEHIQWLHVQDRFAPMGVKMIGVFLEAIRSLAEVDPSRYLAGFQLIPNQVPGFGPVALDQVKISMRVSALMAERIRAGAAPGLDTFLPEATARLGGFSDACHSLTAATTVAIGEEERLIMEMEQVLEGGHHG